MAKAHEPMSDSSALLGAVGDHLSRDSTAAVLERLTQLESEARSGRIRYVCLMVLLASWGLLGWTQTHSNSDVRTRRLVLVDGKGRERAVLGEELLSYGAAGVKPTVGLFINADDAQTHVVSLLAVDSAGTLVLGPAREAIAQLSCDENGASLVVRGKAGRAAIEAVDSVVPKLEVTEY